MKLCAEAGVKKLHEAQITLSTDFSRTPPIWLYIFKLFYTSAILVTISTDYTYTPTQRRLYITY